MHHPLRVGILLAGALVATHAPAGERRSHAGSAHQVTPSASPDTASPAEAIAGKLFDAIKSGSRQTAREVLQRAYRTPDKDQIDQDLYEIGRINQAGRAELILTSIRQTKPGEATLFYHDSLFDLDRAIVVTASLDDPKKMISWERVGVGKKVAPLQTDADRLAAIDSYVKKLAERDVFSGSVIIARSGRPIYRQAFGLAERSNRVSNTPDTRFNIASQVKMFTAIAIAQQFEAGRLSFSDPVEKFLPGYLPEGAGNRIQIRHLLSHTSGLNANALLPLIAGDNSLRLNDHQDYLDAVPFGDRKPESEPGSRYAYSNYGYMILGRILEIASRESFSAYMQRHLFQPAGMIETSLPDLEVGVPNQAVGYETFWRDEGPRTENNWLRIPARAVASGGGYSTAADLLRFSNALRANTLVSEPTLAILTAAQFDNPNYGYGFMRKTTKGGLLVGHTGDLAGACDTFDMWQGTDEQLTFIVLANSSMGSCRPVRDKMISAFTG